MSAIRNPFDLSQAGKGPKAKLVLAFYHASCISLGWFVGSQVMYRLQDKEPMPTWFFVPLFAIVLVASYGWLSTLPPEMTIKRKKETYLKIAGINTVVLIGLVIALAFLK